MNTAYLMNQFFNQSSTCTPHKTSTSPQYNLIKSDEGIEIALAVPGYSKEVLSISVEDQKLKVKAVVEEEEEGTAKTYFKRGIQSGAFEIAYRLSPNLDIESIAARQEDGVLYISIKEKLSVEHQITIA